MVHTSCTGRATPDARSPRDRQRSQGLVWLRGPAITCWQTGRSSSTSKSRPDVRDRGRRVASPLVAGPTFDRCKPSGVSDWRLAEPHADPLSCRDGRHGQCPWGMQAPQRSTRRGHLAAGALPRGSFRERGPSEPAKPGSSTAPARPSVAAPWRPTWPPRPASAWPGRRGRPGRTADPPASSDPYRYMLPELAETAVLKPL